MVLLVGDNRIWVELDEIVRLDGHDVREKVVRSKILNEEINGIVGVLT